MGYAAHYISLQTTISFKTRRKRFLNPVSCQTKEIDTLFLTKSPKVSSYVSVLLVVFPLYCTSVTLTISMSCCEFVFWLLYHAVFFFLSEFLFLLFRRNSIARMNFGEGPSRSSANLSIVLGALYYRKPSESSPHPPLF